jgi:hypothetical protein
MKPTPIGHWSARGKSNKPESATFIEYRNALVVIDQTAPDILVIGIRISTPTDRGPAAGRVGTWRLGAMGMPDRVIADDGPISVSEPISLALARLNRRAS